MLRQMIESIGRRFVVGLIAAVMTALAGAQAARAADGPLEVAKNLAATKYDGWKY